MRLTRLLTLLALGATALSATAPLGAQPNVGDPDFMVRNLESINSESDEYSPYITPNRGWLYFTSSRDGASGIYRSRRSGSVWSSPEYPRQEGVNTVYDDGAFSAPIPPLAEILTLDAEMMRMLGTPGIGLLTGADRSDGKGDADLYIIDVSPDGINLDDVRSIAGVNTDYWEAQGTLAPDASFIIFSSNRPGGAGGVDLYIAGSDGAGGYSAPVNLGAAINTSGDEFSPFIAPDGRTLFFASTGHQGFGGADLYMSQRDARGEWGTPVNLGDRINTSSNELFFFGVGRERCLFASDRPGGKGGLDIYEAQPNVFATSYANVDVTIMDTTSGKPVSGHLRVVEPRLDRTIIETEIPESGARLTLFTGVSYRLEFIPDGFPAASRDLGDLSPGSETGFRLNVGSVPQTPEFVLNAGDVDLPWFISGYYRINTPELLGDLRRRQENGDLRGQKYIADVAGNPAMLAEYAAQAERVRSIVNGFYRRAVQEYFPSYLKGRAQGEYLEITVYGFADPRAVAGTYVEGPVSFFDMRGKEVEVKSGEKLTNFKLAGLRAHYAAEFLDSLFREAAAEGHPEYKTLADRGLIRWRPVSGDVDTSGGADLSELRRVRIDFRRVDPARPDLR